jgi:hypothetical protein
MAYRFRGYHDYSKLAQMSNTQMRSDFAKHEDILLAQTVNGYTLQVLNNPHTYGPFETLRDAYRFCFVLGGLEE